MSALESLQLWMSQHSTLLTALGLGSALVFVASLAAMPFLLCQIPADYFTRPIEAPNSLRTNWLWGLLRNGIGLLLLLAGIAMLVLPGQGLLTILLGLFVMEFPGKRTLEIKLISHPNLYRAANWLRARRGVGPLQHPGRDLP